MGGLEEHFLNIPAELPSPAHPGGAVLHTAVGALPPVASPVLARVSAAYSPASFLPTSASRTGGVEANCGSWLWEKQVKREALDLLLVHFFR